MVKFLIPSHLFELLPEAARVGDSPVASVSFSPGSWGELALEIRRQFPLLAERVLTDAGGIAPGFVLAVNDEIVPRSHTSFDLRVGDEFSIIAAMAGG